MMRRFFPFFILGAFRVSLAGSWGGSAVILGVFWMSLDAFGSLRLYVRVVMGVT